MPDPITISALLASVGINLASELLVRGTDIASRRSSVQRAIISTSDRFSTRVLGLRAALEAWVGNEDFRSELDALKNGQSTRSDADHIDIFIAKSGLQGGTIDNVVASEILTHFYSELWRELAVQIRAQLIGVRISSMDQEVNRKLDSLLGRLPPQPSFQMSRRQQIVCRSLEQKSQELASCT